MTLSPPTLPSSPRDREVLRRRAVRLAGVADPARAAPVGELFLIVRLGAAELYGIPYAHMDEIVRPRGLTPVPCTPDFVAGVLSRRGHLITVLSLCRLLPMEGREEAGDDARIAIIRTEGMTVGLLVDAVEGNDRWTPGALSPALPSPGVRDPSWIAGIHDGRVAMLDIESLLAVISKEEMR
ncbi:MAG: chemotaxis protein CheW [Rhodocyclaceae bacterium]|nr:chemotaxis protein CheW [Rhodocyclaceae bacterium]